MASRRTSLRERYELKEVLGKGGMGVVYRAFDSLMKRDVALKTILDIENPAAAELFYKEWTVLATMVHPNIIGIYDIGEFDQGGMKKPFFVMPLLPGLTLDKLIREGSPRLTVQNVVNIVDQAARGLHAAHERGLVHRDVKPSNIFVMDDDSVKIIDFGIARVTSANSKTSLKGTLFYLSPEQLELRPPTPLSDQFALGVVAYEALTRRRPFDGSTDGEVLEAIRRYSPPPVSELNGSVSYVISQVIHKALAKQPYHRFFNVKEFGDSLQKALRNEPLECFDASKVKPRLERAAQSFEAGDYGFASEILAELESEGHLDQDVAMLRRRLDQAMRQTHIMQLLESARRFFSASEYTLALRKIQEALELDAENAGALALKAQVEKERREKKIEEWIQLAGQHLDNQSFRQARDALSNVLKLKPNETQALEMLAEVGRREQEVAHVREEKGRLYQAAMQAWEKGDVTSALSKLEILIKLDRDLPEGDTGRSSTYQNFFNQVHSEHAAIKNAYEEARRNLAADNFEAALAICRQYLAKYPSHALFQALKYDVEERQRQNLSAVIAESDRRVEEEPDLDRRVAILEDVLKLYPGEPHFEHALRLVRDKRDLVNSIVSKARFFEERGQYNEALDQWQILRSIHERQPGLPFEIERLMKRRDQHARATGKARWVEQTDRYLEAGDYDRALKTIQNALAEFPGEPDLLELEKLVHKNLARGAEAQAEFARARELGEKGSLDESLEALRAAYDLDPRNSVIATVLANSLLDRARRLIDAAEWDAAEESIRAVLALQPNHAAAQSLASQITDRKQEEFISWCVTQARRLQGEGDIDGALALLAQGFVAYPNDARLVQLQATLQRAQTDAQRQRLACLRETRDATRAGTSASEAPPPPAAPPTPDQPPAPGEPCPPAPPLPQSSQPPAAEEAPTVQIAPGRMDETCPSFIEARPSFGEAPTEALDDLLAEISGEGPRQAPAEPPAAAPAPPVPPPVASPAVPPSAPAEAVAPAPARRASSRTRRYAVGAGAVVVLALGAAGVVRMRSKPHPRPSPAAMFKVAFHATPAGAAITVNGQPCGTTSCEAQLPPGVYLAEAFLQGHRSASSEFRISADRGGPSEIRLTLEAPPPPPQMSLSTDLTEGTLLLDGQPAGQIQGGEMEMPSMTPGTHVLEIKSGAAQASISVEFAPGAMPRLAAPMQLKNLKAILLVRLGPAARVYSSAEGVPAILDGKPAGTVGPEGLELKDLAPGTHELNLTVSGQTRKISFETANTPGLVASVFTERNVGSLRVVTGEDDVEVYLNGQKYRRPTHRGRLLVFLAPRTYTVKVEKAGLWAAEQTVDVRKGEEARLEFKLVPARGILEIRGAPPAAEVLLDGTPIGTTRPDGTFTAPNIAMGKHSVVVRKEGFRPFHAEPAIEAAKTVQVNASMASLSGTLRIEVTPPGTAVQLHLRREGDAQSRAVKETELRLAEGAYTVSATAPQFHEASATVRVTAGRTAVATLAMKRAEPAAPRPKEPLASLSLDAWLKTPGWTKEGNLLVKRGGEFTLAPVAPGAGTYQFTVVVVKGKRLEWMVDYRDERNYCIFQIDDKNYIRGEVAGGKKTESLKTLHGIDRKAPIGVRIAVSAGLITHSLLAGQEWKLLDRWNRTRGDATQGKFGFRVPGRDQINLSDFRFTPN